MKKYNLPVTWEVSGIVEIEANSLEEAIDIFNSDPDSIPLPDDSDYVDGSFDLSCPEYEYIALYNDMDDEEESVDDNYYPDFTPEELEKWVKHYKENNNNWSMLDFCYMDEVSGDIVIQKDEAINDCSIIMDISDESGFDFMWLGKAGCAGNFDMYTPFYCAKSDLIYFVLESQNQDYLKHEIIVLHGRKPSKDEYNEIFGENN